MINVKIGPEQKIRPAKPGDEVHRIACPYCSVGYAELLVSKTGPQLQIEAFRDPRKCNVCKRYFRLKPRLKIEGVKMEGNNGR